MLAPTPGSRETMQFEAPDARADDAKRTVSVTRDLVVIARRRQGVTMRIALSPKAFAGVRLAPGRGGGYEVSLAHADPELSVALACSSDEGEALRACLAWAEFVGAPTLVEGEDTVAETIPPAPRPLGRRRAGVGARRPRFLVRRKLGRPETIVPVVRQRELFAGWREDACIDQNADN